MEDGAQYQFPFLLLLPPLSSEILLSWCGPVLDRLFRSGYCTDLSLMAIIMVITIQKMIHNYGNSDTESDT